MSEVKCIYGQSTESPCPRPGTVDLPGHRPGRTRVCEVHAALEPLNEEALDLVLALEKLGELEEYAIEWDNRPLLGLVERARDEFTERREFLEEHTRAISYAGS